jgi:anti-sigma-K factor RskA
MMNEIEALRNKKGDLFLKIMGLTNELDGLDLLMDTKILTKEYLMGQLKALKVAWVNEFTETIEFSEDEVERWLVQYININDEVDDALHQSELDLREFERQLLEIKTKHKSPWHLRESTLRNG